jgi:hypothetical protein
MKNKTIKIIGIGAAVLISMLVFVPATSAVGSSVTGVPKYVGDYGQNGEVDVGLDTNGDNQIDFQRTFEMNQQQHADLIAAKESGQRVTIKYHTDYDGNGNPHFVVDSIQVLNNIKPCDSKLEYLLNWISLYTSDMEIYSGNDVVYP